MSHSNKKLGNADHSDMLREIAIIDYVAGNQSESVKRKFEAMRKQDPDLNQAIEQEQRLRRNMQEVGRSEPVSMSNFDALLETIEEQERQESQEFGGSADERLDEIQAQGHDVKNVTSIFKSKKWSLPKQYASAASVAALTLILAAVYINSTAPDFQTLSDVPASQQLNFAELTKQNRIAKIVLTDGVSDQQVDELLQAYDLTSFESGAAQNQRYVTSQNTISTQAINRLRNDSRVSRVELLKATNGE